MACSMTVQLGSDMILDDTTATSGIVFGYSALEGWWDTADVDIARSNVQPEGETITSARRKGRAMTLAGVAYATGGHTPLEELAYTAARLIALRSRYVHIPGLLKVNDPALAAQAYVRRVGKVRVRINEDLHAVEFEVPLLAPDPNRYAQTAVVDTQLTVTGATTGVAATIVNAGDANSPPSILIDGPATNPAVVNDTISGDPYLQYTGVLGAGDSLLFDVASATVWLNGVNAQAGLTTRGWWHLVPGNNALIYNRFGGTGTSTAQITYRSAYE